MKINMPKIFTYTVTGVILFSGLLFAYMTFVPIDVLKDWSLTVDKSIYREGESAVVTTRFDKLLNVTGIAKRYIVCDTLSGSKTRIPVSEADADRGASKASDEIYLTIPQSIPNLPTTCQFEIVIDYTIYSFRKHTEINRSNAFEVEPEVEEPEDTSMSNPEEDNMVVENAPKNTQTKTFNSEAPRSKPEPEDSPRTPPNDSIVCNLPIQFVVDAVLGIC